jgi:hypothetical protein
MKKAISLLILSVGFILFSCNSKKAQETNESGEQNIVDTIVVNYGSVQVDSISPDSAEVAIQDTTLEIIAEPEKKKEK